MWGKHAQHHNEYRTARKVKAITVFKEQVQTDSANV